VRPVPPANAVLANDRDTLALRAAAAVPAGTKRNCVRCRRFREVRGRRLIREIGRVGSRGRQIRTRRGHEDVRGAQRRAQVHDSEPRLGGQCRRVEVRRDDPRDRRASEAADRVDRLSSSFAMLNAIVATVTVVSAVRLSTSVRLPVRIAS
jgi:hypothetical protein